MLRCETSLVGSHSIVVHSVRVLEETVLLGVLLDVPPAAALPTAGHQVQLLGHLLLGVHIAIEWIIVNHFVDMHGLHGNIASVVLVSLEVRGSFQVVGLATKNVVTVGTESVKSPWAHYFHLTRSAVWCGSLHCVCVVFNDE